MTKIENGNPSQAARLVWFLLMFLSPMVAVGYVSSYGLKDGNQTALVHVLAILAVSMIVSVVCGVAQPIAMFDEARILNAARWNMGFALIDTIIVAILLHDPTAAVRPCEQCVTYRTFPVGWLALAGMHYCWTVWAYTTAWVGAR